MHRRRTVSRASWGLAFALLAGVISSSVTADPAATGGPQAPPSRLAAAVDEPGRSPALYRPSVSASDPPAAGASLVTRASVRRRIRSMDPTEWLRRYGEVERTNLAPR